MLSGVAIAGVLLGRDLVRLVRAGRLPLSKLRRAGFAAAGALAAVGLSGRNTRQILELARRLERAWSAGSMDGKVVRLPTTVG